MASPASVTDRPAVAAGAHGRIRQLFALAPRMWARARKVDGRAAVTGSRRGTPRAAVDDLVGGAPRPWRRAALPSGVGVVGTGARLDGGRVAEGDGPEDLHEGRDGEDPAQLPLAAEDAEEERAEADVLGSEQHRHDRHRRVDGPVRRRPRLRPGAEAAGPLVGLRVALDVRP